MIASILLVVTAPKAPVTLPPTVDAFLASTATFPNGASGTVGISIGGEVVFVKGYGTSDVAEATPMDGEAVLDCASVSKQFLAAGVMKLQEMGKLHLDWNLKKVFPKTPDDKDAVTIRTLLNHTSGIDNLADMKYEGYPYDREKSINYFLNLKMISKPGEKWAYSNIGYFLLAGVIEEVTGETYETWMRKTVFVPAGMKDSYCLGDEGLPKKRVPKADKGTGQQFSYGEHSYWGYKGAGGVYTTARDMLVWDKALKTGFLKPESLKELYTPGQDNYALGWRTFNTPNGFVVDHGGAMPGFSSHFLRGITEDWCVVVLMNSFIYGAAESLARTISGGLHGGTLMARPFANTPSLATVIKPLTGRWINDQGIELEASFRDGRLALCPRNEKTATALFEAVNLSRVPGGHQEKVRESVLTALSDTRESDPETFKKAFAGGGGDSLQGWTQLIDEMKKKGTPFIESNRILNTTESKVVVRFGDAAERLVFSLNGIWIQDVYQSDKYADALLMASGPNAYWFGTTDNWQMVLFQAGLQRDATLTSGESVIKLKKQSP